MKWRNNEKPKDLLFRVSYKFAILRESYFIPEKEDEIWRENVTRVKVTRFIEEKCNEKMMKWTR